MAGEMASFFIRLGTIFDDKGFKDAAAGVKGVESKVDALTGVMKQLGVTVSAGAAIYGIVSFAKSSVEAFAEQERAARRLQGAMQSLGSYSEAAFQDQLAFSQEMQRASTYTDEEVLSVQTLLTTYGLYGDKLKQTTQAVMDLSARKGIDLHAATVMLGKAFDGETGRLAQLGIHFTDTGSRARNFAQIMGEVNRVAGGAAAQELETYSGKVKNLGNRFGELKESIGRELMPTAEMYLGWLQKTAAFMENLNQQQTDAKTGRQLTIQSQSQDIGSIQELISHMEHLGITRTYDGKTVDDLREKLAKLKVAREQEIVSLKEERAERGKPAQPTPRGRDDVTDEGRKRMAASAQSRIEEEELGNSLMVKAGMYMASDADREMFTAQTLANQLRMQAAFENDVAKKHKLTSAAMAVVDKARFSVMVNGAAQALSFIAGAWGQHTAMYKVTSIALATINTYQAVTAALTIPVIGKALAAIVLASGMAMVAKIAGVKLAAGGIVRAASGGTQATLGEGGSDEAVLPLDNFNLSRLAAAIVRSTGGGMAAAGAGGHGAIQISQVFNMAGAGGQGGGGVSDLIEGIRIATRDGVAEALDMAKQVYRTGASLENEA